MKNEWADMSHDSVHLNTSAISIMYNNVLDLNNGIQKILFLKLVLITPAILTMQNNFKMCFSVVYFSFAHFKQ